jgi:hypothetical protein
VTVEKSHRKENITSLVSRIKRADDVVRPEHKMKGSIDIAEWAECSFKVDMPLYIEIHSV